MSKKVVFLCCVVFGFFGTFAQVATEQLVPAHIVPDGFQSFDKQLDTRVALVTFAKKFLGKPYRFGSNDPKKGFDCSGFVNFVFKNFNISVPRSSVAFKDLGVTLRPEEFQNGDILVFYGYKDRAHVGHVGIICEANGMKSKFIHSSSAKVMGVTISELGSEMYTKRFYKCIRVIKK